MLLTITTTHQPATDLGYLVHKNPERFQTFSLSFGKAHVFYPQRDVDRCTVTLLVEVDPIQLVRGKGGAGSDILGPTSRYGGCTSDIAIRAAARGRHLGVGAGGSALIPLHTPYEA